MTQQQLADAIGMTRQTIAAIEQNKYSPSLEAAFRIAEVFGVPIGEVFQWKAGEDKMRAVTYPRYGGPEVLEITSQPEPTAEGGRSVGENQGNVGDIRRCAHARLRCAGSFPHSSPLHAGLAGAQGLILGYEFAGEIEAIGSGVTRFKPGDRVYGGAVRQLCRIRYRRRDWPGCADPRDLTFGDAVSLPFGMTTAMYFLNGGKVSSAASTC